jgi:tRNA A37 threonylcarbamoyladenosine synthetase subunit TsaC/SUA5/YrdC
MEEAFGVTMLKIIEIIVSMCAAHSATTSPSLVIEKQRQCQKELILCVDQLKEFDTPAHRERALWKCVAK